MYNARIETDTGQIFHFGYEHGSVFDIDPLTGVDVDLATSQGYQQIGETLEGQSVGGLSRTVKGVFFRDAATQTAEMLNKLPIFTTGKLYYNDDYYCEITIKKTPVIVTNNVGKTTFTMLLYCNNPFWLSANTNNYTLGGIIPTFRFPVLYNTHQFSTKNSNIFVNCYNGGITQTEFTVEFSANGAVTNFGIIDANTFKFLRFNTRIDGSSLIRIYRKSGKLKTIKITESGEEDIFSTLDEDSSLFELNAGDNLLRAIADSGVDNLQVTISFAEPYMGVVNATD